MNDLLESIKNLQNSEVRNKVDFKINEFETFKNKSIDEIFKELCFCIMTANCSAEKCIEIHESINDGFIRFKHEDLTKKFKELGYRFPNIRSEYIIKARNYKTDLKNLFESDVEEKKLRDFIVNNIKGLGYKEASHFLRNIGFKNYAIVDFHIVDLLVKHYLIEKPKSMTKKKYLEIEEILKTIAKRLKLTLAELDLYLWYLETGKILK